MSYQRNQYSRAPAPGGYPPPSAQPAYNPRSGYAPSYDTGYPRVDANPRADANYYPGFAGVMTSPVDPGHRQSPAPPPEVQQLQTYEAPVFRPKTFDQWLNAARDSTSHAKTHGSALPFVWVLVEGKNIPANAIVAGEERRKPLYIARSFYEVDIGKAGSHLQLGAAIPYNGREIEVGTYEVLVSALTPIRYSISDAMPVQIPIPETPIVTQEPYDVRELKRLNEIKTVILVDDSSSMNGSRWADAREALAGITDLAEKYGSDGVDIFFLNSYRVGKELKNGLAVKHLFDSVDPEGQTPIGQKLSEIFEIYFPRIENRNSEHKPITLVVITDGVPTDDPKSVIINAARRLDHAAVPQHLFGIQFAQIGDEEDATEALRELDDDLEHEHGIRDMVDTTPCHPNDPQFTTGTIVKILLGSINKILDSVPAGPYPRGGPRY
ncbi:hypothetical protein HWV62_28793 [Athelia sp. TMB]|nr:hypothetical protein HWV62_28793 [Athelia sp. TMB]